MAYQGIQRLIEEQKAALSTTNDQLQKWNSFKEDYSKLKNKIEKLPDQVTYDYMVPFGPMAFMPGKLIHTNEILVLLGDNWFADMSAKQSCEVIDRRLANIETNVEKLQEQKKLLESRAVFTEQEFSTQEKDITEAYDSDEDRKWRRAHRESVRKEKLAAKDTACHTNEDVLRRLEALEVQELQEREITRAPVEEWYEAPLDTKHEKTVSWEKDGVRLPVDGLQDSYCSSLDSDDSSGEEAVIHFKHSPRSAEARLPQSEDADRIHSPSDIYRLYSKVGPKSILKAERSFEDVKSNPSSSSARVNYETKGDPLPRPDNERQVTALQEKVVERAAVNTMSPQVQLTSNPVSLPESSVHSEKPAAKRVSKFKAMRQKRQNP
ncbi:unconventional prefoldin RPB5 interactor-like [Watersipora subatra]|uniref:unconventional prefoldin RPB5 interactor-like n=1 Tax=Watersipora subatra TaxID=2589382 RepID=UPI00355B9E3F